MEKGFAVLPVSMNLLMQVFELPPGYEVVDVHPNYMNRTVDFVLRSEQLPEHEPGAEIPRLEILLVRHMDPRTGRVRVRLDSLRLEQFKDGKFEYTDLPKGEGES